MAHETAVHRWDAQVASGPASRSRRSSPPTASPRCSTAGCRRAGGRCRPTAGVVSSAATDAGQDWYLRLRGEGIALLDTDTLLDDDDPHARAQATGTASDLLLAL